MKTPVLLFINTRLYLNGFYLACMKLVVNRFVGDKNGKWLS